MEGRSDGFTAIEDRYAGYTVYDNAGSKIGKVDDLFLDENDQPEYIGVKMGFLGTSSTLIPMELATTDESAGHDHGLHGQGDGKNGPAFDDDREITPSTRTRSAPTTASAPPRARLLRRVRGLGPRGRGTTGPRRPARSVAGMSSGRHRDRRVPRARRRRRGRLPEPGRRPGRRGRAQGAEERGGAPRGTREREAGSVKVRKRVRTDRERVEVPVKHEEVSVERVPVSGEATEAQIGEDEVRCR
jgi:hypothetical protein